MRKRTHLNMEHPEHASGDMTAFSEGSRPLSRRNLPRASHACQSCRLKKARCDQRTPCSNCVNHSFVCIYTAKRTAGATKNTETLSTVGHEDKGTRDKSLRTPMSIDATRSGSTLYSPEAQNPINSTLSGSPRTEIPNAQERSFPSDNVQQQVDPSMRGEGSSLK